MFMAAKEAKESPCHYDVSIEIGQYAQFHEC